MYMYINIAFVEENLEYIKGAPFRAFKKFWLSTHGLFEELDKHASVDGSQDCPNYGACKESIVHVLFKYTS